MLCAFVLLLRAFVLLLCACVLLLRAFVLLLRAFVRLTRLMLLLLLVLHLILLLLVLLAGMMLAAIPNVTITTDGVLCRQAEGGHKAQGAHKAEGGRWTVLTHALRVWNMSVSEIAGEAGMRALGELACARLGFEKVAGTPGGGMEEEVVVGMGLMMLRKYGYQWAHFVFDNAARLALAFHLLALDPHTENLASSSTTCSCKSVDMCCGLHVVVDQVTLHNAHIMFVLEAFLGRQARARVHVLPHCSVHADAFREHAATFDDVRDGRDDRDPQFARHPCSASVRLDRYTTHLPPRDTGVHPASVGQGPPARASRGWCMCQNAC